MVVDGDRVFGKVNSATDYDWFAIDVPAGRSDLVLDVEAWYLGSPADIRLELYNPDGVRHTYDSHSNEDGAYDLDPYLTSSVTAEGRWTVKLLPEVDEEGNSEGGGGNAFWYVLDVGVTSTK